MQLGAFTAHILVEGKELEEYDCVHESPTQVTCWVASEEGKSFAVEWKCHEELRVDATKGGVIVDGICCGAKYSPPGPLGEDDTCQYSRFIGSTATRDLKFSRVQFIDDDSLLIKEIHKDFGEISLTIKRGELRKKPRSCSADKVVLGINDSEKLHESSKKATVHCVGFGPERPRKPSRHQKYLICNAEPMIKFVFKYRPLSILQANGVAPRPCSSIASAGRENERNNMRNRFVTEDIKPAQLNDRIQDLENELKRLRELQGKNSEDRKVKRIKTEGPEIIDLT